MIEQSQKVSLWAAATPANASISESSTNNAFLKAVKYNQFASVIKKCECGVSSLSFELLNDITASAFHKSKKFKNNHPNGYSKHRFFQTPSTYVLRCKACFTCKKYVHWQDRHRFEEFVPHNVPSFNIGEEYIASLDTNNNGKKNGWKNINLQ